MAKATPGRQPDPMAREVDRLLAQLENSGPRPDQEHATSHGGAPAQRRITSGRARAVVLSADAPSRGELIALWGRLVLGIVLGGAMTQWPYARSCDLPLLGYLGAVATVTLAGTWVAFAAWKLRSGVVHILSLMLLFWGIALGAEQILPRIGYAAEKASWRCAAVSAGAPHRPAE